MSERTEVLPGQPPCTVRHRFAVSNGVRLHYVEAQPAATKGKDRLCLLLHGFPELWYSWRRQIPALTAAGYHVLAPDLRGYNQSAKPPGVESYRLEKLTDDVVGLIEHAGESQAAVVGHDWGGGIAWAMAMRRPESVRRLIILNAPHPAAFRRDLSKPLQLLKSWYIFFFQLPWLPEMLFRAGDYALLDWTLRHEPIHAGAFSRRDIALYKQALDRPGALTAAINYYRALVRHLREANAALRPITVPTLLIWGEQDRYLNLGLTEGLQPWVADLRIERLADASHWVQNDAPERVNQLMIEFLQEDKQRSTNNTNKHE